MLLKGNLHEYKLEAQIGTKSAIKFSENFIGKIAGTKSIVFIKRLKSIYNNNEQILRQFVHESNPKLKIKGVPENIELFEFNNCLYSVREYIKGIDLKEILSTRKYRKQLNTQKAISLYLNLCNILQELHKNNIIHCDIKPSNLFVELDEKGNLQIENVWILDLGLAIFNYRDLSIQHKRKKNFSLIYSSPEQVLNIHELVGVQSDIYMLGICMYETWNDKAPFEIDNPEFIMNLMLAQKLESTNKIPKPIYEIIKKATNKYIFPLPPNRYKRPDLVQHLKLAMESRYSTMYELKEDLLTLQNQSIV